MAPTPLGNRADQSVARLSLIRGHPHDRADPTHRHASSYLLGYPIGGIALCRVLTIIGDMDAKDRIIEEQRLLIEELRREIEELKLALAKACKDSSNSSKSPSSDITKPPKRDAQGKTSRKKRKRGGQPIRHVTGLFSIPVRARRGTRFLPQPALLLHKTRAKQHFTSKIVRQV